MRYEVIKPERATLILLIFSTSSIENESNRENNLGEESRSLRNC